MSHRQAATALLAVGVVNLFVAICTGNGTVYMAAATFFVAAVWQAHLA